MNLIKRITDSIFWDNHKDSLFFVAVFVLFPSFLPVWVTLFAMFLTNNWANVSDMVTNGAFFIYSAALLSSAIEKMDGSYKKGTVSLTRFLNHCSWFLIVLSTVGFMVAITPNIFPLENKGTNITNITAFVFVFISLAILYYADYISRREFNPEQENNGRVRDLMEHLS